MYEFIKNIDRRWIFLLMLLAVSIPILTKSTFRETPSSLVRKTFEEIDKLEPGDAVLLSYDFDPASEGELGPMATSFVRHCCEKKLKLYFMALWPVGPQIVDDNAEKIIKKHFPDMVYGRDYVNLGYKSGGEGVIKVIVTDLRQLYTTDSKGTPVDNIEMMRGIRNVQDMKLVITISAGSGGTKEWVQYASTPYPDKIKIVCGCTGVQAPLFYPYIPDQLKGMLGAIKGAAEYEELVNNKYPIERMSDEDQQAFREAKRRMGPQLIAHLLMIALIVVGNIIFAIERRQEPQA